MAKLSGDLVCKVNIFLGIALKHMKLRLSKQFHGFCEYTDYSHGCSKQGTGLSKDTISKISYIDKVCKTL